MSEQTKGGKPNPGTPKDRRLSENKPASQPAPKKPFPGAAKPFKPKKG